jgi:hypothetical protein
MAFVSQTGPPNSDWRIGGSEVRNVMENLVCAIWGKMENTRLPESFPVMTYNHAMSRVRYLSFIHSNASRFRSLSLLFDTSRVPNLLTPFVPY